MKPNTWWGLRRRIFFHHIQKTAGMSLHAAFVREYGANAVSPQIYGATVAEALDTYRDRDVIAGHMLATPGVAVPNGFFSVTVLRDPVERYLSHLFFNLRHLDIPEPARPIGASWWDMVIEREQSGRLSIGNWQVESLYRYAVADDRAIGDEEKLSAALAALDAFSMVGLVEEFSDLIPVIALDCRWHAMPAILHDNVTADRPRGAGLDPRVRSRVEALNSLDMQLWERARQLWPRARFRALIEAHARQVARTVTRTATEGAARESAPDARTIDMGTREVEITHMDIRARPGSAERVPAGALLLLRFSFECHVDCPELTMGIRFVDETGLTVYGTNSRLLGFRMSARKGGRFDAEWQIPCDLGPGGYRVVAILHPETSNDAKCFHYLDPALTFNVGGFLEAPFQGATRLHPRLSIDSPNADVTREELRDEGVCRPVQKDAQGLRIAACPDRMTAGTLSVATLCLANRGPDTWEVEGDSPTNLSYHWFAHDGEVVDFEGIRTSLQQAIPPGHMVTLEAAVLAPEKGGNYVLQWTLVQEGVAWLEKINPEYAQACAVEVADAVPVTGTDGEQERERPPLAA